MITSSIELSSDSKRSPRERTKKNKLKKQRSRRSTPAESKALVAYGGSSTDISPRLPQVRRPYQPSNLPSNTELIKIMVDGMTTNQTLRDQIMTYLKQTYKFEDSDINEQSHQFLSAKNIFRKIQNTIVNAQFRPQGHQLGRPMQKAITLPSNLEAGQAADFNSNNAVQEFQAKKTMDNANQGLALSFPSTKLQDEFKNIDTTPLGYGGFGFVLKAQHNYDQQFYAIKLIKWPDCKDFNRIPVSRTCVETPCSKIFNELRLISGLDHPNVVRYFNVWLDPLPIIATKRQQSTGSEIIVEISENSPHFIGDSDAEEGTEDEYSHSYSRSRPLTTPKSKSRENLKVVEEPSNSTIPPLDMSKIYEEISVESLPSRRKNESLSSSKYRIRTVSYSSVEGIDEIHTESENSDSESSSNSSTGGIIYRTPHESQESESEESSGSSESESDSDDEIIFGSSSRPRTPSIREVIDEESYVKAQTSIKNEIYRAPSVASNWYLCIQMQLCDSTLKDYIETRNSVDIQKSLSFFKQTVKGLEYIHAQGIIHRDLKPANLFLIKDRVLIGDFGLSTRIDEPNHQRDRESSKKNLELVPRNRFGFYSHTLTSGVGTMTYASPEQINGARYSYQTDLYSLGIILIELMVHFKTRGERAHVIPKVKKNPEAIHEIIEEYALCGAGISEEVAVQKKLLGNLIEQMLQPDPKVRISSASEILKNSIFQIEKLRFNELANKFADLERENRCLKMRLEEKERKLKEFERVMKRYRVLENEKIKATMGTFNN